MMCDYPRQLCSGNLVKEKILHNYSNIKYNYFSWSQCWKLCVFIIIENTIISHLQHKYRDIK